MQKHERIQGFVDVLWDWFSKNKRQLPWRDLSIQNENQRAYQILVSEIMLQQTQVSRVKVIYKQFLETFPSLDDLARASNKEVILAWRGMGYNSRALRLRDAARAIASREIGLGLGIGTKKDLEMPVASSPNPNPIHPHPLFPRSMEDLQSLPGIGHYTAAAIRNFAFGLPTACLDTNIRRILHRAFVGPENSDGSWKKDDRYLLTVAGEVLDAALKDTSADMSHRTCATWHAALMDFGSLVCTKRNPKWDICPLTKRGLMKAAYRLRVSDKKRKTIQEPGRFVGSVYIPNRIFRGKVVDELRDEPEGIGLAEIGRRICIDWSPSEHRKWLSDILQKLEVDQLIERKEEGVCACRVKKSRKGDIGILDFFDFFSLRLYFSRLSRWLLLRC